MSVDLIKEYPIEHHAGFLAGEKHYEDGKPLTPETEVPAQYGLYSSYPHMAYLDGFIDGYLEAKELDYKIQLIH